MKWAPREWIDEMKMRCPCQVILTDVEIKGLEILSFMNDLFFIPLLEKKGRARERDDFVGPCLPFECGPIAIPEPSTRGGPSTPPRGIALACVVEGLAASSCSAWLACVRWLVVDPLSVRGVPIEGWIGTVRRIFGGGSRQQVSIETNSQVCA